MIHTRDTDSAGFSKKKMGSGDIPFVGGNDALDRVPYYILGLMLLLIPVLLLASCSRKNYAAKLDKAWAQCDASEKYKSIPPMRCATKYPPKEKIVKQMVYKPGKPKEVPGETIFVDYNCDSAIRSEMDKFAGNKPQRIKVPAPKFLQVDTSAIEMAIERENTAWKAAMDIQADSLKGVIVSANEKTASQIAKTDAEKEKNTELRRSRSKWQVSTGFLGLLVLGGVAFMIKRNGYV